MLLQLPIDKIKIDRSYVHDVGNESPQAIVAKAVIQLGHGLGMKVLAEGIESNCDLQRVELAGCDSYQGYHLAKPMPGAAVAGWIEEHDRQHRHSVHSKRKDGRDDGPPELKIAI